MSKVAKQVRSRAQICFQSPVSLLYRAQVLSSGARDKLRRGTDTR